MEDQGSEATAQGVPGMALAPSTGTLSTKTLLVTLTLRCQLPHVYPAAS